MSETVLVIGATGNIGSAFVHLAASQLAAPRVRVATRDVGSPAAQLLVAMNRSTVEPVGFDVRSDDSMARALDGATRLFVIAPFSQDMKAWHEAVGRAVVRAGTCQHIVKVSVIGARAPSSTPPPGRIPLNHFLGEEALRETGIPLTVVRPNIFMQHFVTMPALYEEGAGEFYLPTGDARIAFLDCRDIAAAAASVLLGDDALRARAAGEAFELTGPEALTAKQIADILSWSAERPIVHVDGVDALMAHVQRIGASAVVKNIYAEAAGGWFGNLAGGDRFAELTGRRQTSFAKFALDHASFFSQR